MRRLLIVSVSGTAALLAHVAPIATVEIAALLAFTLSILFPSHRSTSHTRTKGSNH